MNTKTRPQPKKAREHLLRALKALEDPQAYCRNQGYEPRDDAAANAYVTGCTKACIEFALQALGEPIDPYRELGESYPPSPPPQA